MRFSSRAMNTSRRRSLHLAPLLLIAGCSSGIGAAPDDASTRDLSPPLDASARLGARSCGAATLVRHGSASHVESLDDAETGAGCLGAVRSVAYAVTVPAGETLTARVDRAEGPVVLQLLDGCAATRCLAQSSTSGVTPLRALWRNASASPRELRVLAGSFSTWSGRFSIAFSLEASPTNLRCEDAELLTDGAWRGEQRFAAGETPEALCADRQTPAAAGARWYRFELPPRAVAVATITPGPAAVGREYGVAAVMRSDCAISTCVASTPVLLGARSTLVGDNDGDAPREIRLGVGVYPPQAEGSYSLALAFRPRDGASRCEGAEALTPGQELRGDTALSATILPRCEASSDAGAVRFHAVTIAPNSFLELTAQADDGAWLALRAYASCDVSQCLALGGAGSPSVLRVPNLGDAPRRVIVAVGALEPARRVAYRLVARMVSPDPAGRCEGALNHGARTVTADTFYVAEPGPQCGATRVTGPSQWFRIPVAANTAMRVTALPINDNGRGVPVAVRLLASCDASACLASSLGQAVWANTADAPRDLFVAAGASEASVRGQFSLYAYPQPIAPNSLCARATAINAPGIIAREQSTQSLATAPWCDGSPRSARWYTTSVPAGAALHAWATNPFSAFSSGMPSLALRPACDAACLAEGGPSTSRGSHLWWRNDSGATRSVHIQAGWATLSGSYYDLLTELVAADAPRCVDAESLVTPASVSVGALDGALGATACARENRGPVRWFRVTVGAGRALRVSASGPPTSPPQRIALGVHDGCDGACLAPASGSTTATVLWRNEGASPREVRVSLHADDGAPLRGITLSASEE